MDAVEVGVKRMDRDCGGERVMVGEPEAVLEGRCEKDMLGLPVEVLDVGPERVGVGLEEDVLEAAEVSDWVLEEVTVRVAVAVDVCVFERRAVRVATGLLEGVLDLAAERVGSGVGRIVLLPNELILGRRVPASERVDVVVFVDVLDWVAVFVGIRGKSMRFRCSNVVFQGLVATDPIVANKSSQRMFLLQLYT